MAEHGKKKMERGIRRKQTPMILKWEEEIRDALSSKTVDVRVALNKL